MHELYYMKCHALVLVYSIISLSSFEELSQLLEFDKKMREKRDEGSRVPTAIVG